MKNIRNTIALMILLVSFGAQISAQSNRKERKSKKAQKTIVATKGRIITKLPTRNVVITHRDIAYHYAGGRYYRRSGGVYVMIAPPVGLKITVLLSTHRRVVVHGNTFFFLHGVFYAKSRVGNDYEVVRPPVGARIPDLPEDIEVVVVDQQKYYVFEGTHYKEIITQDNQILYEVVASNHGENHPNTAIGTLVPNISGDYNEVFLNNKKMLLSNGVYYERVIVEGDLYYKVAGVE